MPPIATNIATGVGGMDVTGMQGGTVTNPGTATRSKSLYNQNANHQNECLV